jgi:hypothetical protein
MDKSEMSKVWEWLCADPITVYIPWGLQGVAIQIMPRLVLLMLTILSIQWITLK